MKLLFTKQNRQPLRELLEQVPESVIEVKAAVAYVNGIPHFLKDCFDKARRLTLWGRYDGDAPVSSVTMEWFLNRKPEKYSLRLVDFFHPKVIRWYGFGTYIGSANLTEAAWSKNFEAGVFLPESETTPDMDEEIEQFFELIDSNCYHLTREIYEETVKQEKSRREKLKDFDSRFQETRLLPKSPPLTQWVDKRSRNERRKADFLKEWNDTLQLIRSLSERINEPENRPAWLKNDVSKGAQVDQFLHAYYYIKVTEDRGVAKEYLRFHSRNNADPEGELQRTIEWWHKLPASEVEGEINMLNNWSPKLREALAIDNLPKLTLSEFTEACARIHSVRDHSRRVSNAELNIPEGQNNSSEERIRLFAEFVWKQRSGSGKTILQNWYYVLYGGESARIPERIFESVTSEEWKISHCGLSTIGEVVGWAVPDLYPPCNQRTRKALVALGYVVKVNG